MPSPLNINIVSPICKLISRRFLTKITGASGKFATVQSTSSVHQPNQQGPKRLRRDRGAQHCFCSEGGGLDACRRKPIVRRPDSQVQASSAWSSDTVDRTMGNDNPAVPRQSWNLPRCCLHRSKRRAPCVDPSFEGETEDVRHIHRFRRARSYQDGSLQLDDGGCRFRHRDRRADAGDVELSGRRETGNDSSKLDVRFCSSTKIHGEVIVKVEIMQRA